jgi:hypothetical protein
MIYGFAKQSRGHLKIHSEVGHCTTVRLYLPRHLASVATGALTTVSYFEQPRDGEPSSWSSTIRTSGPSRVRDMLHYRR